MATRPLSEHNWVSFDAVRARALEFPRIGQLVCDHADRMPETRVHPDSGPRLLVLLGKTGARTQSLLGALEATVKLFDALRPAGWERFCHQLRNANRPSHFLSMSAELAVARWLHERGLSVLEFEPETDDGKRPDLLIGLGSEELLIEVVAPGPPEGAVDTLNSRLRAGLERVASGLHVHVSGYRAGPTHTGGQPDAWKRVTKAAIDEVITEFRRNAAQLDTSRLPAPVVESRPGQPVTVTAVALQPGVDRTSVSIIWSESGSVPKVKRLVNVIRQERRHLPDGRSGAVLVDLSQWPDFAGRDYYLDQAQHTLMSHRLPAFVGSFLWQSDHFAPGLGSSMHANPEWAGTVLGQAFTQAWDR